MRKFLTVSLTFLLSGFLLIACERERPVQAGPEEQPEAREPRAPAAPERGALMATEVEGELVRIDTATRTLTVLDEENRQQSIRYDEQTQVIDSTGDGRAVMQPQDLTGKEGSEITVQWREEAGGMIATSIELHEGGTHQRIN